VSSQGENITASGHPALIHYPPQAAFGRVLPKNKIYEHSGAGKRLKELFVDQVDQIVWQTKLAPETINLSARPGVPEIQVFAVKLKTPELHRDVLRCIDGAVLFPVIFELSFQGQTQVVACFKRPSEADRASWVQSEHFATPWLPSGAVRAPMPLALDLGGLYQQLMHRIVPLKARADETLPELVVRQEVVAARLREIDKAASQLAKEKQFNRKVEINTRLRQLNNELKGLSQ
jgi:hypothetical protein